jgi:acyl carrier protein
MDTLNFAVGLKREFGIDVPDTDFRELASVDRCVNYLQDRLAAMPMPP